jgi:hypothetical protein
MSDSKKVPILVVLDVNGLLARRALNSELREANLDIDKYQQLGNGLRLVKRPHLDEFVDFLFDSFEHVGVWSSMRRHNIDAILSHVIPAHRKLSLVMCRESVVPRASPGKRYDSIKALDVLFARHADELGAAFSLANTVLIDDSCLKAVANPRNTLCPLTFELSAHNADNELRATVRPALQSVIDAYRAHQLALAEHAAPLPPLPPFDVRDVIASLPLCAERHIVKHSLKFPDFPIDSPDVVCESPDVVAAVAKARASSQSAPSTPTKQKM